MEATTSSSKPASGLGPFAHHAFAVLWTATVVSNIGTWMQSVAAGWLMTSLTPSPLMVALVQTASTLPAFLFALPAGALADIVDRRKLLAISNAVIGIVAGVFGVLVMAGAVQPLTLLVFTFLMGTSTAVIMPVWQAIVPGLVPRAELQAAVTLNSIGVNVSRAVGPAIAGFIIAAAGVAAPFLLNALSYVGVVAALLWWRQPPRRPSALPAERFGGAIRAGIRFTSQSRPLRAALIRATGFFVFAACYWALLPVIVRDRLHGGPELYGIILGCIGAGAVAGGFALSSLGRSRIDRDRLVAAGTLGTSAVMAAYALIDDPVAISIASVLAGACWVAVLSNLMVAAQTALPEWVRARGVAMFFALFFAAMSGGSLLWGHVAELESITVALLISAAGALLVLPLTWRMKLGAGGDMDLSPSLHWPEPVAASHPDPEDGPVLVTVDYRVDPARATEFIGALRTLESVRRRDGAYGWGLYQDIADPMRFLEYFIVASWVEHLRQHERVTVADRVLEQRIRQLLLEESSPKVSHLIAAHVAGETH